MDQTHIGYTSWDEPKGGNIIPEVKRVNASSCKSGGYVYEETRGVVVMEAEHFAESTQEVIPDGQLFQIWDVHSQGWH